MKHKARLLTLVKRKKAKNLSLKIWRLLAINGYEKTDLPKKLIYKIRKHISWCPLCSLYKHSPLMKYVAREYCNPICPLNCFEEDSLHDKWHKSENGTTYKKLCAWTIYLTIKAWKVW
jgi:hypothetical protein